MAAPWAGWSQSQQRDKDEEQERGNKRVLDGGSEDCRGNERDLQQQRGASPRERAREHHGRGVGGVRGQQLAPPDLRKRRERRGSPLLLPLRRGPAVAVAAAGGRTGDREAGETRAEEGAGRMGDRSGVGDREAHGEVVWN